MCVGRDGERPAAPAIPTRRGVGQSLERPPLADRRPRHSENFFPMSDENEGLLDLWGDPWTPEPDPRGRKRHKRCTLLAENIAVLRASELTEEEIAARVNLDPKTLRKYYSRELKAGPALARAVLNEAMWKKAKTGNVSAARYMREEFGKGDVARAEQRVKEREREKPQAPPVRQGVKAERQAAAQRVGGLLATPEPPSRLQ